MNAVKIIFSIVLGSLFIASAILKLYPIELLELDLGYHLGVSEVLAMIFARLLIGLELMLGILLIINYDRKSIINAAIAVTLVFSAYLIYLMIQFPAQENCGCMGMMVPMTPIESLFKNAGLILLLFTLRVLKPTPYPRFFTKVQRYQRVILIAPLVLPFVLNTVDFAKNEMRATFSNSISNDVVSRLRDNQDEEYLLAYLSPHCVYCKMMARKWEWLKARNEWTIPMHVVFMGENIDADIQEFVKETGFSYTSYETMQPHVFVQLTQGSMPAVYFVKNGKVVQKDNFISFNESNLQSLLSR
jgi:hypothetical protein